MTEIRAGLSKVAVLGANGQVGTELCLYLKVMGFCKPIAVTRASQCTAILSRAGVESRTGDVADPFVAAKLLADVDLVVDLALPKGKTLRETKRLVRKRTTSIFSGVRSLNGYVLASTTSVYRAHPAQPFFRTYRSIKLFSERMTRSLGSVHRIPIYILRLGQVHGLIQSCSERLRQNILTNTGPIYVPNQSSNAVFVYDIAEAIHMIQNSKIEPSTYTVISNPPWSFAELVTRHAHHMKVEPRIVRESVQRRSPNLHGVKAVWAWVLKGMLDLGEYYKELFSAIVSAFSEELDQRIRFIHSRHAAASTIAAYFSNIRYRPFEAMNDIPGNRFPFTKQGRALDTYEHKVEALLIDHEVM